MGLKLTDDKYRFTSSWRYTVCCVGCGSTLRLQYPEGVSAKLYKDRDVIQYNSRCKCGSWYAKYHYNKDGL